MPGGERRYREEEVGEIIRRAVRARTVEGAGAPERESAGLTLGQLQALAAEAGIDPAAIARAAAEVESGGSDQSHFWGGLPTAIVERVVPGELPPEAYAEMAEEIASRLPGPATSRQVGNLLEGSDGSTHIRVRSVRGRTRLEARSRYGDALVGFHTTFLSLAGVAAIGFVGKMGWPGVLAAIGAVGGGFLAGKYLTRHFYRRARSQLAAILSPLAERAEVLAAAGEAAGVEEPAGLHAHRAESPDVVQRVSLGAGEERTR